MLGRLVRHVRTEIDTTITRPRSCRLYSSNHGLFREKPLRMAVLGSGPAGFYTAYRVMSRIQNAIVDMYEQLPVPFGLVRFGVAPDHPEVKNCQDKFTEVASSSRFNFVGNIDIGRDLSLRSFRDHYDAIVFAYGASADRKLGLPGENTLKGIYSARAFVGWYNGLPEYIDLAPDLSGDEAVIVGQGNVALDIARSLLSPIDRLRSTDMTEQALATLAESKVKQIRVVGRRGPMQSSFTIKEVRELMTLPEVGFSPIDSSLLPNPGTTLPRAQKRMTDLLRKHSDSPSHDAPRKWGLDFLLSPKSFNSSASDPNHLSSMTFSKNHLQGPDPFDPSARALATYPEETVTLPAHTAFRSIGYRSEALPGMTEDLDIDFDPYKGVIVNDGVGRALKPQDQSSSSPPAPLPGIYCAGWVKRGPTGVIAGTMEDAFATAEALVHDWSVSNGAPDKAIPFLGGDGQGWDALKSKVSNGKRTISWDDWQVIDRAERERGKRAGKEREKFGSVAEMLQVLD